MTNVAAIRAIDSQNLLDDVLAMPEHLTDALWRVESARLEPMPSTGLVVCGMGGSGIGGELARAAIGDRLSLPLTTVRDYVLPSWTPPDRVVLCASYSGDTEETLACFDAAEAIGARRVVATTGGALGVAARSAKVPVIPIPAALQPRAAVGYMFASAVEMAALAGAAPTIRTEIDAAAAQLAERSDDVLARAAELAQALEGSIPVFYGSDLTGPVAYRWKTQLNENAKLSAFANVLPEMDHNEIVAWNAGGKAFSAVFLLDSDQHPRARERMELTAKLIEGKAHDVRLVEMEGETRSARMLGGVMLGDLLSLHLAAARGIDPTPVPALDELKAQLGRP